MALNAGWYCQVSIVDAHIVWRVPGPWPCVTRCQRKHRTRAYESCHWRQWFMMRHTKSLNMWHNKNYSPGCRQLQPGLVCVFAQASLASSMAAFHLSFCNWVRDWVSHNSQWKWQEVHKRLMVCIANEEGQDANMLFALICILNLKTLYISDLSCGTLCSGVLTRWTAVSCICMLMCCEFHEMQLRCSWLLWVRLWTKASISANSTASSYLHLLRPSVAVHVLIKCQACCRVIATGSASHVRQSCVQQSGGIWCLGSLNRSCYSCFNSKNILWCQCARTLNLLKELAALLQQNNARVVVEIIIGSQHGKSNCTAVEVLHCPHAKFCAHCDTGRS